MPSYTRHKSEPQSDTPSALQNIVRLLARQAARADFSAAHTPNAPCAAKIPRGDGADG
jgi:hypothetical protein